MDDGPSARYEPVMESILCPLCGRAEVPVMYSPGYVSWHVSSISAKKTRVKVFHAAAYRPQAKCSACGAGQAEIRDAIQRGHSKHISHEERLARLKEIGFAGQVKATVKHED